MTSSSLWPNSIAPGCPLGAFPKPIIGQEAFRALDSGHAPPLWLTPAEGGAASLNRLSTGTPYPASGKKRRLPSRCDVAKNVPRTRFVEHSRPCKINAQKALFYNPLVGDSLTVELRTLTPLVLVRIQVPQPIVIITFFAFSQLDRKRHFERILKNLFSFRPLSTTPRAS
ncbi:hypothetical protein CHELA20_51134 [Hyphomicrobiales bacterium]|nr:hypothetical protein CHELA41_23878 [Hyphomicrobiales bacterium]CAH1673932.1 hypothetical protein CHELA20_51134 [Hyphomicrobiales bacterium]